jgi:phenylacetate-CoA ligase
MSTFDTGMWNPVLETLPREQLGELQRRKFREHLAYAYEHSPFYRRKLDDAGVHPDEVETFADIREVPTTTKAELREAQGGEGLYGDLLAADPLEVTEYHQTSGTTGDPVRQADSARDWEWWADSWATVLWAAGIRPDDRVFFPFSYNVFVAFWASHYACERIGAEVVPGGNLSSAQRVRKLDELDATVFMSTPTYSLRLAEVAEEEGFDPRELAVERIVCAGEPGASVAGTKERIESRWDAAVFDHAGATEGGAWGFSCGADRLGLHVNEPNYLVEVLDDDGEPVDPGEVGTVVVTPLDRRAQPYVRFELNDRMELGDRDCPCGRTLRFAPGGVLGRADDLTKINGVLFAPTAVEDVVRSTDAVADEFRLYIEPHERKDIDVPRLVVERAPDAGGADSRDGAVLEELGRELKQTTNLTFDVELREHGSLERFDLKADRVEDRR